jgi:hypothetical protein
MFKYFYNQGMRKLTVAFGMLFNNIYFKKTDRQGNPVQSVKVPLAYGPKEKFLVRLDQQPDLTNKPFATTLPRMGFEITGINYDTSRKLTRVQKFRALKGDTTQRLDYNYMPVPYNISFTLNTFTATSEQGLQIVEQILPYFQPDFTVTINMIPELNIKRDVPIILESVNYEDSYTGDFQTRRAVIYTLNFTAKTYLFGPSKTGDVIKTAQSDIFGSSPETASATREERITVTPNPGDANFNEDFGFTTEIENFADGRVYNPETGEDE